MEERKNNTGLVVLTTVLVMLVLGMGAFIIYDKVINKTNEPNSEENNKVDNNDSNDITEYDYADINKTLNNNLSNFINFRGKTDGVNLLANAEGRLEILNAYLMQNNLTSKYDDGIMQPFPYVSYDVYKTKYVELFGNGYNLDTDLKNVSGPVANDCDDVDSLSGKNICWNGTWGDTLNDIVLNSTKVSNISDNNYSIIGNYVNNGNSETGTFEIQYVKTTNAKYLTSIKLMKK